MVVAYQILVDHEIFRLRDEVEASEGTDVTFYGTVSKPLRVTDIWTDLVPCQIS